MQKRAGVSGYFCTLFGWYQSRCSFTRAAVFFVNALRAKGPVNKWKEEGDMMLFAKVDST